MLPGGRHSESPPTARPARLLQVGQAGEAGGQEPRGPTEDCCRRSAPPGDSESLAYGRGAGGASASAPPPREAQGRWP